MVAIDPQALQLRNISASATFYLPGETRYAGRVSLTRKDAHGDRTWNTGFDLPVFHQSSYAKLAKIEDSRVTRSGVEAVTAFEDVLLRRAVAEFYEIPVDALRALTESSDPTPDDVAVLGPDDAPAQYPSSEVDTIYDAVRDGHVSAAAVIAAARAFESGQPRD